MSQEMNVRKIGRNPVKHVNVYSTRNKPRIWTIRIYPNSIWSWGSTPLLLTGKRDSSRVDSRTSDGIIGEMPVETDCVPLNPIVLDPLFGLRFGSFVNRLSASCK